VTATADVMTRFNPGKESAVASLGVDSGDFEDD
jgi:hypothetical protein